MANTDDMLACLATLQQVTELATLHTVPPAIAEQALARLQPLLHPQQDPALLIAGLQASAHMLPTVQDDTARELFRRLEGIVEVSPLLHASVVCVHGSYH